MGAATKFKTSKCDTNLFGVVSMQSELARGFASSILASIEVHAPGAAKREGSSTGIWVLPLACTGSTVKGTHHEFNLITTMASP